MKIIITGLEEINKLQLAKHLVSINDEFSIASSFSTDDKYNKDIINDKYIYYLNPLDVNLGFKNNSFLFVSTKNFISNGMIIDEYYNNNIIICNIENFNNISNKIFNSTEDILVIWLDTKFHGNIKKEIKETKYLIDRLNNLNYLYFLDEDLVDISNVIFKYINGDKEVQNELLNKYD